MKGFTDTLADLSVDIIDRVFVLNVLCGLNKNFEHLHAIFMQATPFLSFQKMIDDLCLEEIQHGIQGLPAIASTFMTLYAAQKALSSSSSTGGQECPPGQQQHQQLPQQQ
jgi:hypothetical protein